MCPPLAGKTILLIDVGVATGATLFTAIEDLRNLNVRTIVVALPVCPPDTAELLRRKADDVIALATPEPFEAKGHSGTSSSRRSRMGAHAGYLAATSQFSRMATMRGDITTDMELSRVNGGQEVPPELYDPETMSMQDVPWHIANGRLTVRDLIRMTCV